MMLRIFAENAVVLVHEKMATLTIHPTLSSLGHQGPPLAQYPAVADAEGPRHAPEGDAGRRLRRRRKWVLRRADHSAATRPTMVRVTDAEGPRHALEGDAGRRLRRRHRWVLRRADHSAATRGR